MQIFRRVLYHGAVSPLKPAISHNGGVATYGLLRCLFASAVNRIAAAGLPDHGLVAIRVKNPVQHVALMLALEYCGQTSISVPTGFACTSAGLAVDCVITDGLTEPISGVRTVTVDDGWFTTDSTLPATAGTPLAAGQYYRIMLTSGTTGRPKAIGLSPDIMQTRLYHSGIWGNAGGRTLNMLGLSTVGFIGIINGLTSGGMVCFPSGPEEALHMIRLFGVTQLHATAAQLQELVAVQKQTFEPCPSLQAVITGGSRVPPPLLTDIRTLLCSHLMLAYGSSETGIVSYCRADSAASLNGAVGYVAPWATVEAVDEQGIPCPPGTVGSIRIRSDMMAEYADGPIASHQPAAAPDWFYPGDVGAVSAEGMVFLTGRTKEVINRGGAIIAPALIDEVLLEHPDIVDAAAFGVLDDSGMERIWAAVVSGTALDPNEMHRYCSSRLGDKAPDLIVRVDRIPRTDTGKVQRDLVRTAVLAGHNAKNPDRS